jgi:hypothetical protein
MSAAQQGSPTAIAAVIAREVAAVCGEVSSTAGSTFLRSCRVSSSALSCCELTPPPWTVGSSTSSPHPLSLPHQLARSPSCVSAVSLNGSHAGAPSAGSSRLRGSPPAHAPPRTTVQPPTSSPARSHRSSPPLSRRAKTAAVGSSESSSSSMPQRQSPRSLRSRLAGSGGGPETHGPVSSSPARSFDPAFFSYVPSPSTVISSSQANVGRQQPQRQQPSAHAGLNGSGGGEDGTAGCGFEVYSDRPSAAVLSALRRRPDPSPAAGSSSRERRQSRRPSTGSTSTARTDGGVSNAGDDEEVEEEDIAKENIPVPRSTGSPPIGASASAAVLESASTSGPSPGAAALKRRRSASSSLSLCSTSTTTTAVGGRRATGGSRTIETRASRAKVAPSSMPASSEAAVEDALAYRSTATSSPSARSVDAGGTSHSDVDGTEDGESGTGAVNAVTTRRAAASSSPAKRPTTTAAATTASHEMPPPALLRFGPPSTGASLRAAARAVSSPRQGERSSPRHRRPTAVEGVFT